MQKIDSFRLVGFSERFRHSVASQVQICVTKSSKIRSFSGTSRQQTSGEAFRESVFGYSIPPTLERPTEKVRKSCYKPLKMRNTSPPKFIYAKFQVLGTSGKYFSSTFKTRASRQVLKLSWASFAEVHHMRLRRVLLLIDSLKHRFLDDLLETD